MWYIPLATVYLNGVDLAVTYPTCGVDTGAPGLILPRQLTQAIYASIPGSHEVGGGAFAYPCSYVKSFDFKFGNTRWNIPLADFGWGPAEGNSSMCIGAIYYIDDVHCIIGDPFCTFVISFIIYELLLCWKIFSFSSNKLFIPVLIFFESQ